MVAAMGSEDVDPNLTAATIFNMVDMVAARGLGLRLWVESKVESKSQSSLVVLPTWNS